MSPAEIRGLIGLGKIALDILDRNWRLWTRTIVIPGMASTIALPGLVADLMVNLSRQRYDVCPATWR